MCYPRSDWVRSYTIKKVPWTVVRYTTCSFKPWDWTMCSDVLDSMTENGVSGRALIPDDNRSQNQNSKLHFGELFLHAWHASTTNQVSWEMWPVVASVSSISTVRSPVSEKCATQAIKSFKTGLEPCNTIEPSHIKPSKLQIVSAALSWTRRRGI